MQQGCLLVVEGDDEGGGCGDALQVGKTPKVKVLAQVIEYGGYLA